MPYAFPNEIRTVLNKLDVDDIAELVLYAQTNGADGLIDAFKLRYANSLLEIYRQKYKNVGKVETDRDIPPPVGTGNTKPEKKKKPGRKRGFKVSGATREKMSIAKSRWWAQKKKNKQK